MSPVRQIAELFDGDQLILIEASGISWEAAVFYVAGDPRNDPTLTYVDVEARLEGTKAWVPLTLYAGDDGNIDMAIERVEETDSEIVEKVELSLRRVFRTGRS